MSNLEKTIAKAFLEMAEGLETGSFGPRPRIALTGMGSEHGEENAMAAAVAAGEGWSAVGTDTGGSIRQPAAYCGVTGMKPTYGAVSRYGLIAYASSLDQAGPIARSAADCAAVLDVIAVQDRRDSTSLAVKGGFLAGLTGDVRGVRIGLPVQCFGEGLDPQIHAAVLHAAEVLRALYLCLQKNPQAKPSGSSSPFLGRKTCSGFRYASTAQSA